MSATNILEEQPKFAGLGTAILLNMLWQNASEVFRYFVFVMPMMRRALPQIPDVAPMNLPVFLVWGVWDTILIAAISFATWFALERFRSTAKTAILSATAVWMSTLVLLWLALYNMNLATREIVMTALPLAWIELAVAALIVRWCFVRNLKAA